MMRIPHVTVTVLMPPLVPTPAKFMEIVAGITKRARANVVLTLFYR